MGIAAGGLRIKKIQRGQSTVTGNVGSATIAAVNVDKAFLSISTHGSQTGASAALTNATTVQFYNTTGTDNIKFEVIEFE